MAHNKHNDSQKPDGPHKIKFNITAHGLTRLEAGQLNTGADYTIVKLDPQHLHLAHRFHDHIIDSLHGAETAFILSKPESYFQKHLNGTLGEMIAIISDGQLIGQAVIHNPTAAHPKTGMVDMVLPAPPEDISLLQAVSVDPAYRGNSLMKKLVKQWIFDAHKNGRSMLLAEVETHNIASWNSFLKSGLNIVGIGYDDEDGVHLYNIAEKTKTAVKRHLTNEFNRASQGKPAFCPLSDTARQKRLFSKGFQGTALDKASGGLVFKRLG